MTETRRDIVQDFRDTVFESLFEGTIEDDVLDGTAENDRFYISEGTDVFNGFDGDDAVTYPDGATEVITPANVSFFGGGGQDYLIGNFDTASFNGGTGDDAFIGVTDTLVFDGRDGNDSLYALSGIDAIGGINMATFMGGAGHDYLEGTVGNLIFIGGSGNDEIYARVGFADFDGGAGDDTFTLDGFLEGDDVLREVNFTGGDGNDEFRFLDYTNTSGTINFDGGADDDLTELYDPTGDIQINMGAGDDTVRFFFQNVTSGVNVTLALGEGQDSVVVSGTGIDNNTIITIEDFETGEGGDTLALQTLYQTLFPRQTPNPLTKYFIRQDGDDTVISIATFGVNDFVRLSDTLATDLTADNLTSFSFDLEANYTVPTLSPGRFGLTFAGTAGDDVRTGNGSFGGIGGRFSELFIGESGADTLDGFYGNDVIFGDTFTALTDTESLVYNAYRGLFNREPDLAGFSQKQVALNASTLSLLELVEDMMENPEYLFIYEGLDDAGFVAQLFETALGRAPDPEGQAAYTSALAEGRSRASIAAIIITSREMSDRIQVEGAAFASREGIVDTEGFVFRLYRTVLGREPEPDGFETYVTALDADVRSRENLFAEFVASEEFALTYGDLSTEDFVETLYTNVLPGNTDPVGRANFVSALESGELSREDMVAEFVDTPELRLRTAQSVDDFLRTVFLDNGDIIIGGEGDDVMIGGQGTDRFIFDLSAATGHDRILDFRSGEDLVLLDNLAEGQSLEDFILSNAYIDEIDVIITLGLGASLRLIGLAADFVGNDDVTLADVLDLNDFAIFVEEQEAPTAQTQPALPEADMADIATPDDVYDMIDVLI